MQNISFEQAMTRLEEITVLIENGNISLDESVKLYEEGVKLTGICETLLDNAQLKLSKFKGGDKNED
ncbi:MAG: exodeoxyribonuclease VII small subunit [Acutalibacteraceae bacterium]|nr:exodeoxyribonuclease VII small subunit [Acutalibacteraceae bacterium]